MTTNKASSAEQKTIKNSYATNISRAVFNYNPPFLYTDDTIVGTMTIERICCKARKWAGDTTALCCTGENIKLPAIPQPPGPLKNILSSNNHKSKHFQNNIIQYYVALQMISFGITMQFTGPAFMQTFRYNVGYIIELTFCYLC